GLVLEQLCESGIEGVGVARHLAIGQDDSTLDRGHRSYLLRRLAGLSQQDIPLSIDRHGRPPRPTLPQRLGTCQASAVVGPIRVSNATRSSAGVSRKMTTSSSIGP